MRKWWFALMLGAWVTAVPAADKQPLVGPATEKRFPALRVPAGFQATLFACDPLVEYPSVISIGPRPGTLLLAHDYVTGLGIEIVRRDEIRLIADTDGDGYADRTTLFAKGFNSIQGLAWSNGTVFVMHAPHLTALRDTDGDDRADKRQDLLTGLGLTPEKNRSRLHCANGVVAGFDGWLYLAMGDNGTDVRRPEGDRLLFQQGGILRCRPDGTDLHVFAGGLRNIYDLALDDELNVFVRDNENDGGDYMIRVYHSIHGADHGYPYHYRERTDLALGPLADLGRGSSAGGVFYGEAAFPRSHRQGLFFCEWGRSVVFYRRQARAAGFQPMREEDFAVGAPTDPYGFKPTDLVVARDGAIYISDWCDGQRPKRGRARIYRVTATGHTHRPFVTGSTPAEWSRQLQDPRLLARIAAQSRLEAQAANGKSSVTVVATRIVKVLREKIWNARGRIHAVWILAHLRSTAAIDTLLNVAGGDPDPRVRVQAIRAIADLTDPVLTANRLDAGPAGTETSLLLAGLGRETDPRVQREVIIALGRLQWQGLPAWLADYADETDPVLLHAGQQALRRSANWSAILKLLDLPDSHPARTMALRALADRYEPEVIEGLISRLAGDSRPAHRREYAEWLTRVWRRPAAWKYWGYRPAPRPPHAVAWKLSGPIAAALAGVLGDEDREVRVTALKTMRREGLPVSAETLADWLAKERDPLAVAALLEAVGSSASEASTRLLADVVGDDRYKASNRLVALAALDGRLKGKQATRLVTLGSRLEAGPVLAELLERLGRRGDVDSAKLLLSSIASSAPAVRAAAVMSLVTQKSRKLPQRIPGLLEDVDPRVRRAAAQAVGRLAIVSAASRLVERAGDRDVAVRAASLESLVMLKRPGALAAARQALDDENSVLAGLRYLGEFGTEKDVTVIGQLGQRYRSIPVQLAVLSTLDRWQQRGAVEPASLARARADLQGDGGLLLRWHVAGPLSAVEARKLLERLGKPGRPVTEPAGRVVVADGADPTVVLPREKLPPEKTVRLAWTEMNSPETRELEFRAAAGGRLRVVINGAEVYRRDGVRGFQPDFDRFQAIVQKGRNRVVAWVDWDRPSRLQVRFRQKSPAGILERYAQRALGERGDAVRGRKIFLDKKRGLCVLCHRIGEQGGRIGPDLTGVGRRFSKIHLVEALLEPSRSMAPSYQTRVIVLESGRVVTGVQVARTETELTIGDKQGKLHVVKLSEIDEQTVQRISTMPDGIEKRLGDQDFVDLIAFLLSQRDRR
ncbi:MAG: PVC-type heme-binding CxxCH protein [Planctomycetaceae bacterium]